MLKPKLLRQALTDSLPLFQTNPDKLKMFVDGGRIVSTLAPSLSFENQYTLTLFIEDFPSDVDYLFVPILAWLREHQPDIMATEEKRRTGFIHKVDVMSDVLSDIRIDLQLTERAIVKEVDGALHVNHALEPTWPGAPTRPTAIYFNGEVIP
ncbi:tail completion protein [Yersinia phage vB_YenM_56.17]|uniref:Tail completion protein n=1 Tax=Yersinia phage vB_YenM_56.17 TaxID=2918927 RepID=A0AAE9FKP5_9CAUD|nr:MULTISPECIES: phage tail protein [Yersinia]YP_010664291.1 tail completion protein [Yersinia phage vB_YenM_56.17]EKN3689241.1 phage tail protein [Yersinia enterocolitica]EKN4159982.1 phage tail protein [Yersinia enterocolitica]EKN4803065.1 phage tail protein [Yersinia enterocolitica]EKN6417056.1 phage tail protein [Yersinia enterocolitica]ELI8022919.1 phage tail protein [Yersinia enterocolitica]